MIILYELFAKRKYGQYPGFEIPEQLSRSAANRLINKINSHVVTKQNISQDTPSEESNIQAPENSADQTELSTPQEDNHVSSE